MPLRFTQRILDHLAHENYKPSTPDELAANMQIDEPDRDEFDTAIDRLQESGRVEIGDDSRIRLPQYDDEIVGVLRMNRRGFGFLQTDTPYRHGDLFIPPGRSGDAISGDTVRVAVHESRGKRARKPGRQFEGQVVEVIERGHQEFAGVLVKEGKQWWVHPDGKLLHDSVLIRDPHAKNASAGDKVVFELLKYPTGDFYAEGVILKVLGEAGKPDVETQAVIAAHGLRTEFASAVRSEARAASEEFDEKDSSGPWPNREDLTQDFLFTIDPPDAKDFDDAVSIEYDKQSGRWTLGVHIADVTAFVKQGSELDQEAQLRGNSVYLPRMVIPMLPERLSNGVCSLQEGVPRFTKSAFIQLDDEGRVRSQRVARTVIKSAKRLTYLEAQALIDGDPKEAKKHTRTEPQYSDELIEKLKLCDKLARILQERRRRDGMIVLDLPEVELVFDDDGHVTDAVPEDDAFTHKIIEMFMVEANEALARLFDSLGVPVLRRIHPDPVHGDTEDLQMYARAAGQNVPENPTRRDLQKLLEATHGTPAAAAIHFAVLKTLSKASYSPAMIGHYALASLHYAHFTSPIRRYPDLSLHRALEAYLDETDNGKRKLNPKQRTHVGRKLMDDDRVLSEDELITLGRHCSETEIEAAEAERELRDFLVMQFLQENHLGDEFTGVVTGVMRGGVFVQLEKYLVEGRVATEDLPAVKDRSDHWTISEDTGRLHGKRSGASVGIGDVVTVQIVAVDLGGRQMDLVMKGIPRRATDKAPPASSSGKSKQRKGGKRSKSKRRSPAKRRSR